jgi:hypothetical protein
MRSAFFVYIAQFSITDKSWSCNVFPRDMDFSWWQQKYQVSTALYIIEVNTDGYTNQSKS